MTDEHQIAVMRILDNAWINAHTTDRAVSYIHAAMILLDPHGATLAECDQYLPPIDGSHNAGIDAGDEWIADVIARMTHVAEHGGHRSMGGK